MKRSGYWCGPDGRDQFYRTFLNDPFWIDVPTLDAMTDREVSEWLLGRYEKPDAEEKVAEWEEKVAVADAEHAAKPLAVRKAEYLELCRSFGCTDAEAEAEWVKYLEGS